MLRKLPMILLAAWAIPSCQQPVEDDVSPLPPAAPQRYAYQDPRTTVWRVFEGDGDFRPLVQAVPGGLIEWTSGSVVGEGRGLAKGNTPQDGLMARRAARILAARNALLATGGITVGPGGVFQNVSNGTIRLDAVLRDFQEIRSDFDPATRSATSAVRIPLYGARGLIRIAGLDLRDTPRTWSWGEAPAGGPAAGSRQETQTIVMDLRGARFPPVLLPRFLTAAGECVFDPSELGVDELSWRPAATYVEYHGRRLDGAGALVKVPPPAGRETPADKAFADSVERTFPGAVVFWGCRAGSQGGSVVLSADAVEYLRSHPQTRQVFRSGKVVLVVRPVAAADVP